MTDNEDAIPEYYRFNILLFIIVTRDHRKSCICICSNPNSYHDIHAYSCFHHCNEIWDDHLRRVCKGAPSGLCYIWLWAAPRIGGTKHSQLHEKWTKLWAPRVIYPHARDLAEIPNGVFKLFSQLRRLLVINYWRAKHCMHHSVPQVFALNPPFHGAGRMRRQLQQKYIPLQVTRVMPVSPGTNNCDGKWIFESTISWHSFVFRQCLGLLSSFALSSTPRPPSRHQQPQMVILSL